MFKNGKIPSNPFKYIIDGKEVSEEFINKTLMYNDWLKDDLIQYFEERCK